MDFPRHPFWDFTLDVHGRPGVHEACLGLQRSLGADVNLVFFGCYGGAIGAGAWGKDRIRRLMAAVGPWQDEIVKPLWTARWKLTDGFGSFPQDRVASLRNALVAAEIDGEHMEQLHLASVFGHKADDTVPAARRMADALENVLDYLELLVDNPAPTGVDPTDRSRRLTARVMASVATIVQAAFPEFERMAVLSMLEEKMELDQKAYASDASEAR